MKLKDSVIQHRSDSGFAKAIFLSASLMIDGCGGAPQHAPRQAQPPAAVAPLEVRCMGEIESAGAGQSLSLGQTPRSSYVFRINSLGAGEVNADVTVPVVIREWPNVFTFSARFNGVRFRRSDLEGALLRICRGMERDMGGHVRQAGYSDANAPTGLERLMQSMLMAGSVNRAIGGVARLRAGDVGDDDVDFRVLGFSENEYHIKIAGGPFAGQVFTLDRRVEFGVDRFEAPEGSLTLPMRILEMNTRGTSYGIAMMIDCARPMEADFPAMMEYRGINPSCGK